MLIASLMMGFIMAGELGERCRELKDIYQSAIHIKTELEYRGADICDCFNRRGRLFSKAYRYITDDALMPPDAIKEACRREKLLKDDDKAVIFAYAENLNKEDLGGQIANVSLLIENLRLRIKDAEEEYASKSRLYKSGGLLTGLGFIILIL